MDLTFEELKKNLENLKYCRKYHKEIFFKKVLL